MSCMNDIANWNIWIYSTWNKNVLETRRLTLLENQSGKRFGLTFGSKCELLSGSRKIPSNSDRYLTERKLSFSFVTLKRKNQEASLHNACSLSGNPCHSTSDSWNIYNRCKSPTSNNFFYIVKISLRILFEPLSVKHQTTCHEFQMYSNDPLLRL